MSTRFTTWWAWSLCGLYALILAATCGVIWFGVAPGGDLFVATASGYAIVGALVASRTPANPIGWLLLTIAVASGLSNLGFVYGSDPGLPGGVAAVWFANWAQFVPIYLATMVLPLLFPTGRPLSRRWRLAVAVAMAALALTIVGAALLEGDLDTRSEAPVSNPFGVTGDLGRVVSAIWTVGNGLALAAVVLGAVALVIRLRRSSGRERQQVKILAYVVVALLLVGVLLFVLQGAVPAIPTWWWDLVWAVGILLFSLGPPVAIGIAILRHRLYGIDVVINQTLVYGALTVTLAVAYLALFLLLQELVISQVTSDSDLAVAASTLAVASLSRPARGRIQRVVDRHFYRARYDATRTLEQFATQVRDELDLATLTEDLRQAIQDSLQPTHVSLWLRTR